MRMSIIATFDVGCSYGLGDDSFLPAQRNPDPDIEWVGVNNPFGNGTTRDLDGPGRDLVERWRHLSIQELSRPVTETGWHPGMGVERDEFRARIQELIEKVVVTRCTVTVFSIGTAFLWLETSHDDVDIDLVAGMLNCWEFAAYRPDVALQVLAATKDHLRGAVDPSRQDFAVLTRRAGPVTRRSGERYESTLFRAFTTVVDVAQDSAVEEKRLLSALGVDPDDGIEFEYHGTLFYSWAACVLRPRGQDDPQQELQRLWECIRIAHVFQGALQAFRKIFDEEINSQVERYVDAKVKLRDLDELNRLRTVALAVVTLTNVERVTEADEDRDYFRRFWESAQLERSQQLLQDSVTVLYEVQAAETQEVRARRESSLNAVVVVLAFLTVISVTADAYNFVREEEVLLAPQSVRFHFLIYSVVLLTVLATLVVVRGARVGLARRRSRLRFRRSRSHGRH